MQSIKAVVRNGRIETTAPIDWPEGTEVMVSLPQSEVSEEQDGIDSPEAITDWLNWYDSLEPLIFTEDELAAMQADRKARKDWEQAHFDERADKLARSWE